MKACHKIERYICMWFGLKASMLVFCWCQKYFTFKAWNIFRKFEKHTPSFSFLFMAFQEKIKVNTLYFVDLQKAVQLIKQVLLLGMKIWWWKLSNLSTSFYLIEWFVCFLRPNVSAARTTGADQAATFKPHEPTVSNIKSMLWSVECLISAHTLYGKWVMPLVANGSPLTRSQNVSAIIIERKLSL